MQRAKETYATLSITVTNRNVKLNTDSKIAFHSIQDIKNDGELFFDYHYNKKKKKL